MEVLCLVKFGSTIPKLDAEVLRFGNFATGRCVASGFAAATICHLRVLGQNPKVRSEPLYFNDLGFRSNFRRRRTRCRWIGSVETKMSRVGGNEGWKRVRSI